MGSQAFFRANGTIAFIQLLIMNRCLIDLKSLEPVLKAIISFALTLVFTNRSRTNLKFIDIF